MSACSDDLPDDVDALKALVARLREQLSSRAIEIEQLKLTIAKLRRVQFGRKSEKLDHQIEQLELRLEDLLADEGAADMSAPAAAPRPRRESTHRHQRIAGGDARGALGTARRGKASIQYQRTRRLVRLNRASLARNQAPTARAALGPAYISGAQPIVAAKPPWNSYGHPEGRKPALRPQTRELVGLNMPLNSGPEKMRARAPRCAQSACHCNLIHHYQNHLSIAK